MYKNNFLVKHYNQIKKNGIKTLLKKLISLFFIFCQIPIFFISVPIFIIIILIKPWYLIRWGQLHASRLGHFAVNTELYCCEQDANINFPKQRYKDFFYLTQYTSNKALEKMWRRSVTILPSWLLKPIHKISNFFYSLLGKKNIHEINNPIQEDRDFYNLFDKFNSHVSFTVEEEVNGREILEKFGLPKNAKFICLIVRDSGYLNRNIEHENLRRWDYHNYRDGDIDRYVMAAEELASRGYYVFRMGINVKKPLKSSNSRIIDYANSEMRSDFMDVYLGAKCFFCVSTGCGFDGIPVLFRRPVAYVVVPIVSFFTSREKFLFLTKHHINKLTKKKLSISEIFLSNVSMALSVKEFKDNNIELEENTPEEIRDLVIEMDERINQKWKETEEDRILQNSFWTNYKKGVDNLNSYLKQHGKIRAPLKHGKMKAKFSAKYLRDNKNWLN